MSKRHPLCALTVAPYYLDKRVWAVSTMTVTRDRKRFLIWINTGVKVVYHEKQFASREAVRLSKALKVPLIYGLKKGDTVLMCDRIEMSKYGLLGHVL